MILISRTTICYAQIILARGNNSHEYVKRGQMTRNLDKVFMTHTNFKHFLKIDDMTITSIQ